MEFNWTTFILEIINFLVLVWLLKRLLYQPIQKIIIEREQSIQKKIDDANQIKKNADELQKKYENRLRDWEREKEENLIQLHDQIKQEKKQRLANLDLELKNEREKVRVQEEHRIANVVSKKEKEVIAHGVKFIAVLLKQFADVNLENKILEIFMPKLLVILQEKAGLLKKELDSCRVDSCEALIIKSAYQLTDEHKNKILSSLEQIFSDTKIMPRFELEPKLLAGFVVSIGSIVVQANLQDELQLFAETEFNERSSNRCK